MKYDTQMFFNRNPEVPSHVLFDPVEPVIYVADRSHIKFVESVILICGKLNSGSSHFTVYGIIRRASVSGLSLTVMCDRTELPIWS